MLNHREISLQDQLVATQDWWRDAGVDMGFHDTPQAWLGDEEETPKRPVPIASAVLVEEPEDADPSVSIDLSAMPDELARFQQWFCDPQTSMPGTIGKRPAAYGATQAKLMIIAPMPETGDAETLFAGPHGQLFGNFLRAAGISPETVYFGTALPTHTPFADWADCAKAGLGKVLLHHIALVRPARILVFGADVARLLELDPARLDQSVQLSETSIPFLTTRAADHVLANARQRARFWQRFLDWTNVQ